VTHYRDCPQATQLQADLIASETVVRSTAESIRNLRSHQTPDLALESALLDALFEAHRRTQAVCRALERFRLVE